MYFQIFHDGLPQLSGGTADHSKSFGPRAANDGSHMIAPWAVCVILQHFKDQTHTELFLNFKPTTFSTYCTPMDKYWNILEPSLLTVFTSSPQPGLPTDAKMELFQRGCAQNVKRVL